MIFRRSVIFVTIPTTMTSGFVIRWIHGLDAPARIIRIVFRRLRVIDCILIVKAVIFDFSILVSTLSRERTYLPGTRLQEQQRVIEQGQGFRQNHFGYFLVIVWTIQRAFDQRSPALPVDCLSPAG